MDILLVYKRPRPEALEIHDACLSHVKSVLAAKKLSFETCYREDLKPEHIRNRFVITLGGDGTLLETSHHIKDNVLLGVNSNPDTSVGSLCAANLISFQKILEDYWAGILKPVSIIRIQLQLNGRQIPTLALNDLLIAHREPAAMTRYQIEVGTEKALHKNSGLWVCTPCGSSGAAASTGGKVQKITEDRLQWICREPYFAQKPIPGLLTGFLPKGQFLKLTSHMADGRIFIDGPHGSEPFPEGHQLILSVSDCKLSWLMTPDMEKRRQAIGRLREQHDIENAEGGTRTRTGVPGRF